MKVVVISGGIGSGKSTVCRMIEKEYGWPVYDADRRVKELYAEHPSLLNDIEEALKDNLRDDEGAFVPSLLAKRIFSDSHALLIVEGLVFPVLTDDFRRWKESHADKDYVVMESATILEKPSLIGLGDHIVVVDAPLHVRIERAVRRSQASAGSVKARAELQKLMNDISMGNVPDCVDWVIMNDNDLDTLSRNVRDCIGNMLKT